MVLLGVSEEPVPVNTRLVLEKGLTIIGRGRSGRGDFERAVRLLETDDVFLGRMRHLISCSAEVRGIEDISRAFALAGSWEPLYDVFQNSDYYKNICGLLCSPQLKQLLEQKDYTLDFKLHPIFSAYKPLFQVESERVKVIDQIDKMEEYEIFITDFSSLAFDFFYLGRRVFRFIPDEMQFQCGMNAYREIEPESEKLFVRLRDEEELYRIFESENMCCALRWEKKV